MSPRRLLDVQSGALVAGIVSALALVASLLFLARQTRASTQQSVLANQIAGLQAKSDVYATFDRILYQFVEFPHLRQYFYDGAALPDEPPDAALTGTRDQVLVFAELFANALEMGLDTYRSVRPAADFRTPMDVYSADVVAGSPAIRYLVKAHPGWWPNLESWIRDRDAP